MTDMKPKDVFDAHIALSQFYQVRLDRRHKAEWWVALGLWALLASCVIYVKEKPNLWAADALICSLVIGYIFFWLEPLAARTEEDHRNAFEQVRAATRLVSTTPLEGFRGKPPFGKRFHAIAAIWFAALAIAHLHTLPGIKGTKTGETTIVVNINGVASRSPATATSPELISARHDSTAGK